MPDAVGQLCALPVSHADESAGTISFQGAHGQTRYARAHLLRVRCGFLPFAFAGEAQPQERDAVQGVGSGEAGDVRMRDLPGDRESETGSGQGASGVGAVEPLEDIRQVLGGESRTVVAYGRLGSAVATGYDHHIDGTARRAELGSASGAGRCGRSGRPADRGRSPRRRPEVPLLWPGRPGRGPDRSSRTAPGRASR
jgi:hypothetical protein